MSYQFVLEKNWRDPRLATITKTAEALQVPVGAPFVMAAEENDLGRTDSRQASILSRAAIDLIPAASDAEACHS